MLYVDAATISQVTSLLQTNSKQTRLPIHSNRVNVFVYLILTGSHCYLKWFHNITSLVFLDTRPNQKQGHSRSNLGDTRQNGLALLCGETNTGNFELPHDRSGRRCL